jgi:Amt family ammonium transporter
MSTDDLAMAGLSARLDSLSTSADIMWVLICGFLVFFMQAGFAMVEAGSVKQKNSLNILFKNICDACIATLGFWLIGYGIAYGSADNGFIGTRYGYALSDDAFIGAGKFVDDAEGAAFNYHFWFFQCVFAATAATIVSGSVAERCKLDAYFLYSFVISIWVYPVIVCWCWGYGWLSPFGADTGEFLFNGSKSNNFIDFAGSGVVHMVGGFSGLVGAMMLGPRLGKFNADGSANATPGHNITLALLGVLILWFGWYGFNAGSTLGITGSLAQIAGKVATVTTISAAAAGSAVILFQKVTQVPYDLGQVGNGILAGLVSITAACAVVEPWAAMCIGVIGALVYLGAAKLLLVLQIDDPVEAAPIHGFCGAWGVLAVGIFGTDKNAAFAGYVGSAAGYDVFKGGEQFGVQIVGVLSIIAWTVVNAGLLFFLIHSTIGLRVSSEMEMEGLDESEHGGKAYNPDEEVVVAGKFEAA